jgi:hypothetical protein
MKRFCTVVLLIAASLVAACASDPPTIRESLDERTGVTFRRLDKPLILFSDNSALAAHARDYVYIGPVSINRMGRYNYYLWMGIWSTVASADPGGVHDSFESVVLYVDGEPLPLEAAGWTPDALGLSGSAYVRPVASATDAYYPVTLDQIRMLANADDIVLRTSGFEGRSYQPWDRQQSTLAALRLFVEDEY